MQRIDRRRYNSAGSWLADINLVVSNCIEYNPPTNQMGKVLRHRAFALSDMATSLIDIEMSKKFEQVSGVHSLHSTSVMNFCTLDDSWLVFLVNYR